MNKVAGLLLAAGTSSRMGKPKQLLPIGGLTLLDCVLEQALRSDLDLVTLVLGFSAQEIRQTLRVDPHHPKLKVVQNDRYQEGISSSIIAGLSAVEDEYDHVMVILGDMPYVTSRLINLLLRRYLESPFPLGAVKVKAKRSHPVIISRHFYPDLHLLQGDAGARDLFAKAADRICWVESEKEDADLDIDTAADYRQLKKSLGEETP
ncbi:MAG: nucleotidyltransferase family protein [Desulfobacterales bacterium]|nr:nucleotidyltransferase family protein [Desulfobacterales bacterium]